MKGEPQDLLFISTERYKFCVLAYDAKTGEIITKANGDLQVNYYFFSGVLNLYIDINYYYCCYCYYWDCCSKLF